MKQHLACAASLLALATPNAAQADGHCEIVEPIFLPPGSRATPSAPTPMPPGAPLMIVPNWDASLLAGNDEPYNIQAGANVVNLGINGTGIPPIALTLGSMRSAQNIADELNANATFQTVAEASASNLHNGGGMAPAALYIRSMGAEFGLIEVQVHPQNAYATLGLTVALNLPSVNAAQRVVFEQAFADWEGMILAGGNISSPYVARIAYRLAQPGGGLASAGPIYSGSVIVGGYLDFDSSETWFEDPTPADDSEFAGGGGPGGMDLLMIARHELGHALGWVQETSRLAVTTTLTSNMGMADNIAVVASTVGFASSGSIQVDSETMTYSGLSPTNFFNIIRSPNAVVHNAGASVARSDNDYDVTRLNIGVLGRGGHVDPIEHPGDIMRPLFNVNVRSPISLYPTVARLTLSQGATGPLSVISVGGSANPDGRAVAPWPNLTNAAPSTPAGIPFLITQGTYLEPLLPLVVNQAHELLKARGTDPVFR